MWDTTGLAGSATGIAGSIFTPAHGVTDRCFAAAHEIADPPVTELVQTLPALLDSSRSGPQQSIAPYDVDARRAWRGIPRKPMGSPSGCFTAAHGVADPSLTQLGPDIARSR